MAFQAHNFTLDDTYKLTDSVTANSAGVTTVGTVAFIDLGQVSPAFNVNTSSNRPYARFAVVIDYGAIDVVTGDEEYNIEVQGANATSFATTYRCVLSRIGYAAGSGRPNATPPNGRLVLYADNAVTDSASDANSIITTRYLRLIVTPYGTTPSFTINKAWLVPL